VAAAALTWAALAAASAAALAAALGPRPGELGGLRWEWLAPAYGSVLGRAAWSRPNLSLWWYLGGIGFARFR
jgi:integrase